MTLYGIQQNDIQEHQYAGLDTFAFVAKGIIFFTDRETALRFSNEVVELNPVSR